MSENPDDEWADANDLVTLRGAVFQLHARFKAMFLSVHDPIGLSPVEGNVLSLIVYRRDPVTVPQVARTLGYPRQTAMRAVNALIEAKMIDTRRNPNHKRAQLLSPTVHGKAALAHSRALSENIAMKFEPYLKDYDCRGIARELFGIIRQIEVAAHEINDEDIED